MQIVFFVLQKKSQNKLCLEPHDTYVLFRTFFSHVNNKQLFFMAGGALNAMASYAILQGTGYDFKGTKPVEIIFMFLCNYA